VWQLKAQFEGIPFNYAYMRSADIRVEFLLDGVYDMAIISRLAVDSYLPLGGLCNGSRTGSTLLLMSSSLFAILVKRNRCAG
jgi:hypothetical protein